jgi:hypothetical protein
MSKPGATATAVKPPAGVDNSAVAPEVEALPNSLPFREEDPPPAAQVNEPSDSRAPVPVAEEIRGLEAEAAGAARLIELRAGMDVEYTDPYPNRGDGTYTKNVAKVSRIVDVTGIVNLCIFVATPSDVTDAVRAAVRVRYDVTGAPGTWRFLPT